MIGYKITASNHSLKYIRKYDGWSEGSPKLEAKAKEAAAKAVVKAIMKQGAQLVVGGPAGAVVKVADILSKPLQGLGSAAGQLIADSILQIARSQAANGMTVSSMEVTLAGDFEGSYRLEDPNDLEELPKLLALIPAKGTKDGFMGEAVLEHAFWAHANFARFIYARGDWDLSNRGAQPLTVKIEL